MTYLLLMIGATMSFIFSGAPPPAYTIFFTAGNNALPARITTIAAAQKHIASLLQQHTTHMAESFFINVPRQEQIIKKLIMHACLLLLKITCKYEQTVPTKSFQKTI